MKLKKMQKMKQNTWKGDKIHEDKISQELVRKHEKKHQKGQQSHNKNERKVR
jgi:hypothetical protein